MREHPRSATAVTLGCILAVAVAASTPGTFVSDFRFEVYWDPGKTFSNLQYARDAEGGLGRSQASDRGLLSSGLFWLLRGAGLPAWAVQRVWFWGLSLVGAIGVRELAAGAGSDRRDDHLAGFVAALAYAFSPVALGLLRPSPIFIAYAVTPWVILALLRGPARRDLVWPATVGLCTLMLSSHEVPALAYIAGFCVVVIGVQLVTRAVRVADLARFLGVTALVTALLNAQVLARLALSSAELATRLAVTETPETPAAASSYAESLRGMGHWLSYFRFGAQPRDHLAALTENALVVGATFAVVAVAVAWLLFGRGERRLLYGVLLAASVMAAVGLHPVGDSTPYGRILGWLYDEFPSTRALRNTSKAGPGIAVGVCVLFGCAVSAGLARARGQGVRVGVAVAALALVALAGFPILQGRMYPESATQTAIPAYWHEAAHYLDALPGDPTLLIVPGTATTEYVWGSVGDDIVAGLVDGPWIRSNGYLTSEAVTSNLVDSVDAALTQRLRLYASAAPMLQALGVDHLVLRNDVAWARAGVPPPIAYRPLRNDPDLRLVATFGDDDAPAVEIYAVPEPGGSAQSVGVTDPSPDLVIVGDGGAVPPLAAHPELGHTSAFVFSSALADHEIREALDDGAVLLVTDSNIITERRVSGGRVLLSAPLPASALDDDGTATFTAPGAQSVPTHGDAALVTSNVAHVGRPADRPEQAFDNSTRTSWRLPDAFVAASWLRVEFADPVEMGTVEIEAGATDVTPAEVAVDGAVVADVGAIAAGSVASVDLSGITGTAVEFRFEPKEFGRAMQVAEIRIAELDLRPGRRVPTRLFERADANPDLAAAIASAPLAFSFQRDVDTARPVVEVELRRTFTTDVSREFRVSGWLTGFFANHPFDGCRQFLEIDGAPVEVQPTADPHPETGLTPFESCEPVTLEAGDHVLTPRPAVALEAVLISDAPAPIPPAPTTDARVIQERPDRVELSVDVPDGGGLVLAGVAYQSGWEATIDGTSAPVRSINTLAAVQVSAGSHEVTFTYGPQRLYRIGLWLTYAGLIGCVVLGVGRLVRARRPRARHAAPPPPAETPLPRPMRSAVALPVATVTALGLGYLMASLTGVAVAGATVALVAVGQRLVAGAACLAAIATSMVLTLVEADLVTNSDYALERPWAARFAQAAVVIFAAATVTLLLRGSDEGGRSPGDGAEPDSERTNRTLAG